MRPQMTRSFRISDALALVAATGVGLAGWRLLLSRPNFDWGNLMADQDKSVSMRLWLVALAAIPVASILLLSWTTTVLLLRLRFPRPRRRHL
jgi:hypothetical protein